MEKNVFALLCCMLLTITAVPMVSLVGEPSRIQQSNDQQFLHAMTSLSETQVQSSPTVKQGIASSSAEQRQEERTQEPRELLADEGKGSTCDCESQQGLVTTADSTDADDLAYRLQTHESRNDTKALIEAEEQLAAQQNLPSKNTPTTSGRGDDTPHVTVVADQEGHPGNGEPARGSDVLVAGSSLSEINPSSASDDEGNLWVAVEHANAADYNITLYKSTDDGRTWSSWLRVYTSVDCTNPSLTVGDGNEDWLFLAFTVDGKKIYVLRVAPDDPTNFDMSLIESDTYKASQPRIITDCTEFGAWYAYLIYNKEVSGQPAYWTVRFSQSLDFGGNWTTPKTIASYCQADYYNAVNAHPAIDYGGTILYAAYDNYPPGCTGPNRDIFVVKSTNYGSSWSNPLQLTTDTDDEFDPSVGAVKNLTSNRTAVVSFTRYYDALDYDIWYKTTQNGGTSWSTYHCLSCEIGDNEKRSDLQTSTSRGMLHAGYWHNGNVTYRGAGYQTPTSWSSRLVINEQKKASSTYPRPSLVVNPTYPASQECGFAWTDFRNSATMYDVYFDALYLTDNIPPNVPSNPSPANQSTGVSTTADLGWTGGDPDPNDTVTYDIYFGTSSTPQKIASNKTTTSYDPGTLSFSTTYYWRIVAWDNHQASTRGPLWWFTTEAQGAKPDLIVTDVWNQEQVVSYQIRNIGSASASGGHQTGLYVDNQYVASDYVQVSLSPGQRYTRFFSGYSWNGSQYSDIMTVIADNNHQISESNETNNQRSETWKCDITAPKITSGPKAQNVTEHAAQIEWTTNEASNSLVSYGGKAGVFDHTQSASTLVGFHRINLTNLLSDTTYNFQVTSTDASDNTVTSDQVYFTTDVSEDPVSPMISFFNTTTAQLSQLPLRFFANASDNTGVDRVEFYMDEVLFDTAFSAPFHGFLDPAYLNLSHDEFYMDHTFMARAYDRNDNIFQMEAERAIPEPCHEVHLEIRSLLGSNAYIYTDDYVAHGDIHLEAFAEENTGYMFLFDDMGRSHSRERWDPPEQIDFYIDDDLVYTCAPDEKIVEYDWDAEGLPLGGYDFRVVATASDGCHHEADVRFVVTQTQPEIAVEQDIDREDTFFHVSVYLRSTGEEAAYPYNMTVHLTGYQAIQQDGADYTMMPHYNPATRKCQVEIEFDSGFVLDPFELYTIEFLAVPVMYDGLDFNNINAYVVYRDDEYEYHYDHYTELESWEYLRDYAHEAFNESTYLIITNPTNLYTIYDADDVDVLLSKAAELAVLKHAVLGYYATYASVFTSYDSSDRVATGNVRDDDLEEIVILDSASDKLAVYDAKARMNTITYANLSHNDQLAVGNVYPTDVFSGDPHDYDEILIADTALVDEHKIAIYQINLSRSWTFQFVGKFTTNFDEGDQIATGNVNSVGYDQIIIAHPEDGTIEIYDPLNPTPLQSFDSVFTSGDTLLVGNVDATSEDEIIVVHVSSGFIYCYDSDGSSALFHLQPLSTDDSITLGDINSDTVMEILVADASAEEINTYGSVEEHLALDSHGSFQDCDALVAGDVFGDADAELIVARAHRDYHRYPGEMDIFPFDSYREFDSRQALDDLINEGGSWAENLNDAWISDGYLLIIGEDEAIPSFSCREDGKTVRQTDRYYASTDVGESGRHRELSTGRIIGDNPERLTKPIQVSMDIYNGDAEFDLSAALAVAGYSKGYNGKSDSIDFVGERNGVADKLDAIGFDVVDELTTYATSKPSGVNDSVFILQRRNLFFDHVTDKDLIHLAGHGNWDLWDLILAYNVTMNYTAGDAHPLVYASSCLTGQYAAGYGFAERFFDKDISSYIGATEVSYCCMNTDLANRFYHRVLPGKSLGTSLIQALNSHASGGPWYERDIRRYNSAIYHFYGDPTLTYSGAGACEIQDETQQQEKPQRSGTVSFTLPMYTVTTLNETDYVRIPGGGLVIAPGMPLVPSYTATVEYPGSYHIDEVLLTNRSGMSTEFGLNLTTGVWAEAGESLGNTGEGPQEVEIWPEDVFSWEVVHDAADAVILSITMYPFYYNNLTTEAHYYRNYTFMVNGSEDSVVITKTTSDHVVYEPGNLVGVDVFLQNLLGQPTDVIIGTTIITEDNETVDDGLPLRVLHTLQGVASLSLAWNTTGCIPGAYVYRINLCDLNGTVLDTRDHRFVIGVASGVISNFTATPQVFTPGNDIEISILFTNTGTLDMDAVAVLTIVSPNGALLQSTRYSLGNLSPQQTAEVIDTWETAGQSEGSYQVSCYVLYDGMSTNALGLTVRTNAPPETPSNPSPANDAQNIPVTTTLSWTGSDPDEDDSVSYDVYFGTSYPPGLVAAGLTSCVYAPGELAYSTMFFWQIVAHDDHGHTMNSPAWHFTTELDATPPVTTLLLQGTLGENGWYRSPVTVTLVAVDSQSGVDYTMYKVDTGPWTVYTAPFVITGDGQHTVLVYSVDEEGNVENTITCNLKIDATLPGTSHTFTGTLGDNGWFISDVTVTLVSTDTCSGVNHTYYQLDSGGWATYLQPLVVSSEDTHTLQYYAMDMAGNKEPVKGPFSFKIDKTTTVTTHAFSGTLGENYWFISNVTITITATDPTPPKNTALLPLAATGKGPSGVNHTYYKLDAGAWTEYSTSIMVFAEGAQNLSYYSVDKAGNTEQVKGPYLLKIDMTPPDIALTASKTGLNKWMLSATVSDATSGVSRVTFYVDGDLQGTINTPGPYVWNYTGSGKTATAIGYDNAGNAKTSPGVSCQESGLNMQSTCELLSLQQRYLIHWGR